MEIKLKPFIVGVTIGVLIPYIPYFFSKKGTNMMDTMKSRIVKVKDTAKDMAVDAGKTTISNIDGALESINDKIDTIIKNISKIDVSKVKAKSKTSWKVIRNIEHC